MLVSDTKCKHVVLDGTSGKIEWVPTDGTKAWSVYATPGSSYNHTGSNGVTFAGSTISYSTPTNMLLDNENIKIEHVTGEIWIAVYE